MMPSGIGRRFLPVLGRRQQQNKPTRQIHSLRKHIKEGPTQCRSESKTQDWSKPAAMAIPKGGFFQDKVEQGRYGPIFPKTPACYGFSIVAKVIPGREEVFYKYAKKHRENDRGAAGRPRRPAVALSALGALSDQGGHLLHVSGHFRHRLRQVYRRRVDAISASLASERCSRIFEGFPMDWQTNLRPSSSLSATINARASSNTRNIRM